MKKTYKQMQQELNELLDKFERSEHDDVDGLLADYEKAKQLIDALEKMLTEAELKITKK